MSKDDSSAGEFLLVMFIMTCFIAAIIVPLAVFSTVEYDGLVFDKTRDEILDLYFVSGSDKKVWVNSVLELRPGVWHLSLKARDKGGENDIDALLGSVFGKEFYRLDH